MYAILLGVTLCVALWFLQGQRSTIRRYGQRLPRPPGTLPLAGNGIWFLQPRHKLLDWFVKCERMVGFSTFEISVPSLPPGIVINDPQNVEHVLKNNDIFIKGEFVRARSWDLFGNGIINADGDLWKVQRKAGIRFFSTTNLKTLIDVVLPPLVADTEKILDAAAENATVVDLQSVFLELTTRLMGNMAYSMDMPASLPFSKAFDFASGAIGERFQNPFYKLKEFLFGTPLRNSIHEVKTFGSCIVSAAIQKRKEHTDSGSAKPLPDNLINSLLDNIEDRNVVADAAMNYLSAGRDTTAQSLTWTLYLLMRHPSVQYLIISELRNTVATTSHSLHLSFECVHSSVLPYTSAVFNEVLRLYPPVPIEIKECTTATTFPDGTWLPKGAVVMWATWALGRSKKIWGEDADDFRPERWLVSREGGGSTLKSVSSYEYPVFNAGPRLCVGKKMAELLAVYVITNLVWNYDFEECFGNAKRRPIERKSQNSLTLPMEGGLPCYVRRRGEGSVKL